MSALATSLPPFFARREELDAERARRRHRAVLRKLFAGDWRDVLLAMGRSQHLFRLVERHDGSVRPFMMKANLFRQAVTLLADMTLNERPSLILPEDAAEQRAFLDDLRDQSMLDALVHQAVLTAHAEGVAFLLAERSPQTGRAALRLLDNDEVVAVGPLGGDGLPTVFERRWVVERGDGPRKVTYLRIERHRVVGGRGVVEQEAYRWGRRESGAMSPVVGDTLADASRLERVPLAEAALPGATTPPEILETGAPNPLIVQVVIYAMRGEPRAKLSDHELDLLDQVTASLSQIARAVALHANPRIRVTEAMVDPESGRVRSSIEAVVGDEDKVVGYIDVSFAFDEMLGLLNKVMQLALGDLEVSPALLGMKLDAGANPDTVDKLRLEATRTLAAINRSGLFVAPALGRALTVASWLDSAAPLAVNPGAGYPVEPVGVRLRPGLPRDQAAIIAEQTAMLVAGVTSRRQAVIAIHGAENADTVLTEIEADRSADTMAQRESLYLPPLPRSADAAAGDGSVGQSGAPTQPSPPAPPPPPPPPGGGDPGGPGGIGVPS